MVRVLVMVRVLAVPGMVIMHRVLTRLGMLKVLA
jgi:hypothetical protein